MKKFSLLMLLLIFAGSIFAQQKQINKQLPIGVFDSGTGGLTILQAILTLDAFNNKTGDPGGDGIPDFSNEAFQYLADQANMPYGNNAAANKANKEYIKDVPLIPTILRLLLTGVLKRHCPMYTTSCIR